MPKQLWKNDGLAVEITTGKHSTEIPQNSAKIIGELLTSVGAQGLFKASMGEKARASEHSPCITIAGELDARSNSFVAIVKPGDNGTRYAYRVSFSKECREKSQEIFVRMKDEVEDLYGEEGLESAVMENKSVIRRRHQARDVLKDETVLACVLEHVRALEDVLPKGMVTRRQALSAVVECGLECSAQGALEYLISSGYLRGEAVMLAGGEVPHVAITPDARRFLSKFLSASGEKAEMLDAETVMFAKKILALRRRTDSFEELSEKLAENADLQVSLADEVGSVRQSVAELKKELQDKEILLERLELRRAELDKEESSLRAELSVVCRIREKLQALEAEDCG
ncbi:MAG TPA: hypothetical protein PKA31_02945 [Candidatus Moranbacteria bacterium]|nr:hypothetical protein [Candidatus Moranbacteria bacterium]